MDHLCYKGFVGTKEVDSDDGVLFGTVKTNGDLLVYQGKDHWELTKAFRESVDDYIALCNELGKPIG